MSYSIEQSMPIPNDHPGIMKQVIKDLEDRERFGIEKYGIPLQPFNGKKALVDAYQEAIDLVVYLRQKIEEDQHKKTDLMILYKWLLNKNYLTREGYQILIEKLERDLQ